MADPKKYYGYEDIKVFDARIATEAKKMTSLLGEFKKLYDEIVADRKVNCQDFPKALFTYIAADLVHTKSYVAIL